MAQQVRFNFTGKPNLPKAESNRPFFKEIEKDGQKMVSMNFGILESKNNMGFVEMFGSIPKNKTIKTMSTDNEKIEINWDDRFEKNALKAVANYKKCTVDLGEDFGGRQEFISSYDAILFLKEHLPNYNGKLCVTGQMQKQWYKDKYYDKFQLQNVYAVDDEHKNRLSLSVDIYYRKDCVDKSDFEKEKKIYIDGYISQYIGKEEGTKFVPQRFVFSSAKYDLSNEKHKRLLEYKKKYLLPNTKKWVHLLWEVVMINGAEEVDFDESQLTDAQREQIELGIKTLDDFKPNGAIYGERTSEYRLLEPTLIKTNTDDFSEGFVNTELSDSEFEEAIYNPPKTERMSEVLKEAEQKEETESEKEEDIEIDDDDLDDLF